VLIGDLGEVAEGLDRVLGHAFAIFVHGAELPHGHGLAGVGGILQSGQQIIAGHATPCPIEHVGHVERCVCRSLGVCWKCGGKPHQTCQSHGNQGIAPNGPHYSPLVRLLANDHE
jgi:hypothetical protein